MRGDSMSVKAKDVADRMGVSVSTIYKAFNGAEDINEETRAAILETSAEMGYAGRPRQRFSKRACVFMGRMEAPHVTYYLYEVMIAFKQVAEEYGYEVIIRSLEDEDSLSYNRIMEQGHFEGALVLGPNDSSSFFSQLEQIAYPAVLVDNYVESKMISCVTSDNLLGMGMVVSHLIQLGHKRIGFINGEQLSHTSRERFAGYLNAITLGGLTYDPQLVINGDFSEHSGGVCAEKLLEKNVTALVCASDLMAIGAIRRLKALGLQVPRDISVTGFDDIRIATYISPTLTTIRINIKDVGYRAFMCLKDLIEYKNAARVVETPRLMVRESTAPPNT